MELKLDFNPSVEPNATAIRLFDLRNELAHPKMVTESLNELISQQEYERRQTELGGDKPSIEGTAHSSCSRSAYSVHRGLPLDETVAMLNTHKPNEEQLKMLTLGMEMFVGVLGNVVSGVGENRH